MSPAARARATWKRGLSALVAFARGDYGRPLPVAPSLPAMMSRSAAHARLAVACMQGDILIEYTPGQRVVVDGKLGGLEVDFIAPGCAPEHAFEARPVTVDWCGKDAIAWGYDL